MSQILPSILQPIHNKSHYIHKSSSSSTYQFCKPIQLKAKQQCGWSLRCGGAIAIGIAAVSSSSTTITREEEEGISEKRKNKPSPAEISRTIMELSSVGTLSILTKEGFPLGIGVRFAVDPQQGTPILCLPSNFSSSSSSSSKSTLHVQLEQCGLRTPQCTIQGTLDKPQDKTLLKNLQSIWRKRFEEEVDENLIHIVAAECILQTEDFMEDGVWFTSLDYNMAVPDPLRDSAESIIHEINTNNMEDIHRFCNIYVDLNFQVLGAKMIWVDRLGFDLRLTSPQNDIFEVRIPFPREVTDEKGAKSSFNCMSQLAWEMEKNYHARDLSKVNQLKKVAGRGH